MKTLIDTYKLMQGIEKYVVGGAIAGLTAVAWHDDQNSAYTDGSTIYLPRPNSLFTEEELLLWRYKAEHELGHEDAVNSCPHWKEVMVEKKKDAKVKDDGLLWWISNVISDHVQERNRIGDLIGRDEVLLQGRQNFLKNMVFAAATEKGAKATEDEVKGLGMFLWDTRARTKWNPHITLPTLDPKAVALADKIEREAGVDLSKVMNEEDVFNAAVKVRKLFPEIPPVNNFNNALSGDGKPSNGGDATKEGKGGKDGKDKGKIKDKDPLNAKAIPFNPTGNHGDKTVSRTYSFEDKEGVYNPRWPTTLAKSRRGGRSADGSFMGAVRSLTRRTNLPAKVRGYLMAMKREKWTTGYRTGRLDTNRLTDVMRGKEDLFRRKEDIRLVDSAVYLLVDSSGSMSGTAFQSACASALMMAEALQGINVSVEIAGFTEYGEEKNDLIHDMWLPFGQRFVKENVLQKMGVMSNALSNNADGENILYAYHRLKAQNKSRKILIVLSDGQPAASGPVGSTMDIGAYTKRVINNIQNDKDVIIIGLGMSGYSPKQFYKNAYKVEHGQPLEPVLLDIVKNGVLK